MTTSLSLLDYAVIIAYLLAMLVLGLAIGKNIRTGREFFLAGRQLPWWAVGLSLVATDIGGTDIIGAGGAAYSHGLAVANFEWIGCIPAMIVGAFLFIPFFWRLGIYTIPEYLERRFNGTLRAAVAACWLLFMASNLGVMLLASGKMMHLVFGWNQGACIFATAVLVGIYTCAGGLAAVVYTDTIQCVIMIAGCLVVLVLGLADVGGWAGLRAVVESDAAAGGSAHHLSLILPVDTSTPFPWTGILFGLALVLSPAYWIGNQAIVQRSLGAKSEFEAKSAYVYGAVLKTLIPVIIAVPGLIAFVKFPDLRDGDHAFPMLVSTLLPTGLRGLFIAAFLAALMSSVDSYLNSASTILTHDIYERLAGRKLDDRIVLRVGRLTTVALVVWAILFAFLLSGSSEGIYGIFQTMMSFFQGPAFAVLITGMLWRRATGVAACVAFISGVVVAVGLYALNLPAVCRAFGLQPLFQIQQPYLYFSIWAFLVSLSLILLISLLTAPEPEHKLACVAGFRTRSTTP